MKKINKLLPALGLLIFSCVLFACSKEDLQGFADAYFDAEDAAAGGFTWVGSASSESQCEHMCGARDYTIYRYNTKTKTCYCK